MGTWEHGSILEGNKDPPGRPSLFKCPTLSSNFVCRIPLQKNNRRRFLSSVIKLVYIRSTQRHPFKMESYFRCCLRDTRYTRNRYQLVSQLRRMLLEWHGILPFISQSGFSFGRAFFSFTVHCYFIAILKTSADSNAGQSHRLTHCIKNLHCFNLKSLTFKHSLLLIHAFKNTTQLLKTSFL